MYRALGKMTVLGDIIEYMGFLKAWFVQCKKNIGRQESRKHGSPNAETQCQGDTKECMGFLKTWFATGKKT